MNAPILIVASLSHIAALSWIGFSLPSTILPARRWIYHVPIAYPLGVGIYTWLLFLLGWAGLPIARSSALGLPALLLIIALYLGVHSLRKASQLANSVLSRAIPWLAFYRLYGAEGSASLSAWRQMVSSIVAGQFDWYNLRLLFGFTRRYIFNFSTWGVLFLFYFGLWGINWRRLIPNRENMRGNIVGTLALMSVSLGAVTMFIYIGISSVTPDFLAWMQQSSGRAVHPGVVLAGVSHFILQRPGKMPALSLKHSLWMSTQRAKSRKKRD